MIDVFAKYMKNPMKETKVVLLPVIVTLVVLTTMVVCALVGFKNTVVMWTFFVAMSFGVTVYVVQGVGMYSTE